LVQNVRFQGLRSQIKRSLLFVNEHLSGKRNAENGRCGQTRMNKLIIIFIVLSFSCKSFDPNNCIQELYNPDGTVKSLTPIKDGKIEGVLKQFDSEGKPEVEENYHNNLKNGWQIKYNPATGNIIYKAMFCNDTMQGPMIQYYLEGMLWRESNYSKGHLEGIVKTYWPDGKIKMETPFEHGKQLPGEKKYDEKGNLLKSK